MSESRLAFHRITADKYPTSNVAECVNEIDRLRRELGYVVYDRYGPSLGDPLPFSVDPHSATVASPGSGNGLTAEQRVAAYWAEQRDKPSPYGVASGSMLPAGDIFGGKSVARQVIASALASLIPTPEERCHVCHWPICEGGCQVGACSNGDQPIRIDQEGRPCS